MTYKEVACATSLVVLLAILAGVDDSHGRCRFPAIYNFGDSNSDTGGRSASLGVLSPPYAGVTFFHKPSGRYCDGRLVVDFIAEDLGLPYLSAYLDSIGTSFRHGANFATAGSSIRPGGYSPFHLAIQVSQFIRFKSRATLLQDHHRGLTGLLSSLSLWWLGKLPRPDDFSKALYMIDIGQNDLFSGLQHDAPEQVLASVPDILNQFISAIQDLYKEGARSFWIHNTGPVGCLPYSVNYHGSKSGRLDQIGCVEAQNHVAREFNRQLKERLDNLSLEHPQACITQFDMYTAKYELFSRAKKQGQLTDPFGICCGSFDSHQHNTCGELAAVNGTLCRDPSKYVSWDGIHYSEASNRQIASYIIDGSLSTPPVAIRNACHCMHL